MRNAKKLGLVGRVILGVGALGGLVNMSGCASVVGGYVGAKVAQANKSKERKLDNGNYVISGPRRELAIKYYKDFNGNGEADIPEEILGNIEDSINLDKYGLVIQLGSTSSYPITYSVLDFKENKIIEEKINILNCSWSTSADVFSGDWIDNLNRISKEKPGQYTICAKQEGCEDIFKKTITITRNSVGLPENTSNNK